MKAVNRIEKAGAVILAGGMGTRIRALHPSVPKPMIEVSGLPFLGWVMRYLKHQGITDLCVSTGYKAEVIEAYLEPGGIPSVREEEPLGTAGGFLAGAPELSGKDSLMAVNGDSLVLADLAPAVEALESWDGVIIGREVDDCSRYGSLALDGEGRLVGFEEKRTGAGMINAGIYLFPSKLLHEFPATRPLSFEYEVFPSLLGAGKRIFTCRTDAPFIDIGTPESLAEAEAFIKKHRGFFGAP